MKAEREIAIGKMNGIWYNMNRPALSQSELRAAKRAASFRRATSKTAMKALTDKKKSLR